MELIQENSSRLGGYLVGIGKISMDGEVTFNYLDKPIHNRITSAGLDHLLCYNGKATGGLTINEMVDRRGSGLLYVPYKTSIPHRGILTYLGIGTDGTETSFDDTDLHAPVETKSSSLYYMTSSQFVNTILNTSNGTITHRISHTSAAATEARTIRELGWFGSHTSTSDPTYVLFSRIVLDYPFELNVGEKLITMYELVQSTDLTVTHSTSFFGILDKDGNTLQCDSRIYYSCWPTLSYANSGDATAVEKGLDYSSWLTYNVMNPPPWTWYGYLHQGGERPYVDGPSYSTSATKTFPTMNTTDSTSMSVAMHTSTVRSASFVDYTGVGTNDKYRDFKFTIGAMSPGISSPTGYIDFTYLRFRGRDYRFGYYEEDGTTWHSQALRKFGNQTLILTNRTRYVTDDTVSG